ncbi:hypothetical protein [Actinospica robiniae]|uniref:hypothetical protein n=1 Tax=Actinospica robiniae TaxID=304901 RepID=UPI0004145FF3|nr:hypothetical protein [Actinospica robiniae]
MKVLLPSRRVVRVGAAVTLASAAVSASVMPAQAATYPVVNFKVSAGATYTSGTATFYNRSVILTGADRAEAGECRWTAVYTFDSGGKFLNEDISGQGWVCGNGGPNNATFTINVAADQAGGAAYIEVLLMGGDNLSGTGQWGTVLKTNDFSRTAS